MTYTKVLTPSTGDALVMCGERSLPVLKQGWGHHEISATRAELSPYHSNHQHHLQSVYVGRNLEDHLDHQILYPGQGDLPVDQVA